MGMFKVFLAVAWLALLVMSVLAFNHDDLSAGQVFVADLQALSWRAAFSTDLMAHLALMALWVAWRHRFSPAGIVLGLLCLLGGALFSFGYIAVQCQRSRGDMRMLLLGSRSKGIST